MQKPLGIAKLKTIYGNVARRYDLQHALVTAGADWRGRRFVVENAVRIGDQVLDGGAGTGSTGLLASKVSGEKGHITLFDLSKDMLSIAEERIHNESLDNRVSCVVGDMANLPFDDGEFDVALATYSICPLQNPEDGARELWRVVKPGGRIGVAHSVKPEGRAMRWIAEKVEALAWQIPSLSLGCQAISVLPSFEKLGARIIKKKTLGVPLWPFLAFVLEKT